MSHFRMAVIIPDDSVDLHELMAPYDENIRVEPYVYLTRAEALEEARGKIAEAAKRIDEGTGDTYDRQLASHADDDDDALIAWYADRWCERERDADDNLLSTYNPDSKWDYYGEIETLTLKEWAESGRDETEEELRKDWRKLSSRGDGFWSAAYYKENYGDEDTFVKSCLLPAGWGVVTPDGAWHAPGDVGWFGMDDATAQSRREWAETFHEKFIEPYDPEAKVVIVDCHI